MMGLLFGFSFITQQIGKVIGAEQNITSFKEKRMKLPVKKESNCFKSSEDIKLLWKRGFALEMISDQESLPPYRLVKTEYFDLDGNGVTDEFALRDGIITVKADSHIIWQSPNNWWVDDFFLEDTNNDGTSELNLLVWKEGSFGSQKPFWIEEEITEVKNHFFIFKLEQGDIKPVWQSSNLDHPNYCATSIDINSDGKNELITIEGSYTEPYKQEVTIWEWNGWGFSRLIQKGAGSLFR
ncbi:MAG TPA: hypothetical protein GXX18_18450 [Bacillales bacterium]|nr:hypothetical protein [Bacillales bacterium]